MNFWKVEMSLTKIFEISKKNLDNHDIHDNIEDVTGTTQKMKFYVKDFSSKCDQIRSFLCSVTIKQPKISCLLEKTY